MRQTGKKRPSASHDRQRGLQRQIYRNAGILMSGRLAAGVINLAYLAIVARVLGPAGLGLLALIQAYADVNAMLTRFTPQPIFIRYGLRYMEYGDKAKLQEILKLMFLLLLFNIAAGTALASASAPFVAEWAGISDELIWAVVLVTFSEALAAGGSGAILRSLNRFGIVARQPVAAATLKLVGAGFLWVTHGELVDFVLLTVGVKVILAAYIWLVALRALRQGGWLSGLTPKLRGITRDHRKIWRFTFGASMNAKLSLVTDALPTLVTGGIIGTEAAGFLRIAKQFTKILRRPAKFMDASLTPELGKLLAREDLKVFGAILMSLLRMVAIFALPVLAVFFFAGEPLLRLIAGDPFIGAYTILVLLAVHRITEFLNFPLRSAAIVMGKVGMDLRILVTASILFLPAMWWGLHQWGLEGLGVSLIAHSTLCLLLRAGYLYRLIDRRKREVKAKRLRRQTVKRSELSQAPDGVQPDV